MEFSLKKKESIAQGQAFVDFTALVCPPLEMGCLGRGGKY